MEILQKRGALTHFQILGEISKQEPNLKQKDLAERLNITIQAVSENIKILTEKGYITSNDGRAPYKITQKGIAKVKKDAIILRKYSDSVLETMTYYKSVWPALAKEDLKEGDEVGLYMEDGKLYASLNAQTSAFADVILDTNMEFQKALGIQMIPYVLIVDGTGKIVYRHNGYTEGAEQELIEKVRELVK